MSASAEIYNYDARIRRYRRSIGNLKNGDLALRFLDHLAAFGLSKARLSKYASHLPPLLRVVDFDLAKATRQDVEKVVAWINSQPYREWTKHDKKLVLRKLIQYAKFGSCARDAPIPEEVKWVRLNVSGRDVRVTPDKLLKADDFRALVKAADNRRDKAMLYVLFEAALRPGELLKMDVGSVDFKDGYCLISVNGKTGVKRIPLVVSFKPLLEWLEEHPDRANPNAPLWTSLSTNRKGVRISYERFRCMIKRTARKAGLKNDVWPYLFRHSMLTELAKVFTEAKLEQYAGWIHGSKMAKQYVHFSARDLEDAVLELHGLKKSEATDGLPKLVECPRCGNKNPPGNVRCSYCGLILDRETAIKIEEGEKRREDEILRRLERLERVVSSLISPMSNANGAPEQAFSALQSPAEPPPKRVSQQPRIHRSSDTTRRRAAKT